ncbi:MAG: hypothetical protein K1Y36_17980 [Blastocatellia bacterium]|nr:hypothetical protein [Blastocatellia bacterium]
MSKINDEPTLSPRLKAWFLGPKAENEELLEKFLLDAFRDYCYWRRNFHPEDEPYVGAVDRLDRDFQEYREVLHDRLFEMVSLLKRSIPSFSPRYLGHMTSDLLMPAVLGYTAAMLYNQNNIYKEASTITLQLESEAVKLMARMLHLDPAQAWGHLCSGGTAANLESLWAARNVRLYPYQLALALEHARGKGGTPTQPEVARTLAEFTVGTGGTFGEMVAAGRLGRLRLTDMLALRDQMVAASGHQHELGRHVKPFLGLGWSDLFSGLRAVSTTTLPANFKVLVSANAHYSLLKALGIIGLGEANLVKLPLDRAMRLDTAQLQHRLHDLLQEGDCILAVVGVYGSTEEGAIDDFDRLVEIREAFRAEQEVDFWLHGDACYGGYALSLSHPCPADQRQGAADIAFFLREMLKEQVKSEISSTVAWSELHTQNWVRRSLALQHCDSISIDPHKLGYIPYPSGAVCFQDYRVREFIRYDAPYLNVAAEPPPAATVTSHHQSRPATHWDIGELGKYTLEGSRSGACGAAVWLAHQTVPLDRSGHGQTIAQSVLGARRLQSVLETELTLEHPSGVGCCFLCEDPDLNILCYTFPSVVRYPELDGLALQVPLAVLNRAVNHFFTECLPTEDRPTLTRDFVVSLTSLSEHEYGDTLTHFFERLQQRGLVGELVKQHPDGTVAGNPWRDDHQVTVVRTVVMSPFFLQAGTRPRMQSSRRDLVFEYAEFLQKDLERIFKAELNRPVAPTARPTLTRKVLIIESVEETLSIFCAQFRRISFQAEPEQVIGVKSCTAARPYLADAEIVLFDFETPGESEAESLAFLDLLRESPQVKGVVVFVSSRRLHALLQENTRRRSDWHVTFHHKPAPLSVNFQATANVIMADVWDALQLK